MKVQFGDRPQIAPCRFGTGYIFRQGVLRLAVGMFQGPGVFRYCAQNVTREMMEELQTQANVL